ncbi:T9SS type A sorting domain-containing protein [Hymenobacter perfusus]|uniref:T9SS C-terminal target domain-containing protein n=1 Tax=Hymenobacter perfusus TaxID=1236770 RepID=A0A3R9MHZ6_9BACT|nr:T9SS type A sorting domain-containing protein [Hymenobacter perfusus]RSK46262.1 T9SS C-terminal target domain-containing protein [Hymenobacter perfusus]
MIQTFIRFRLGCAFCAFAILLLSSSSWAQTAPAWSSTRAIGHGSVFGAHVAIDASGNTYEAGTFNATTSIGGTTLRSVGDTDAYVAKYTPAGVLAWVRQIGSTGSEGIGDITVDAAGNAYITGYFAASITLGDNLTLVGGNAIIPKIMVIRYSPQGTPEWVQQNRSTPPNDTAIGSGIRVDASGILYLTGSFDNPLTIESTTITVPNVKGAYLARLSAATGALQSLAPIYQYGPLTGNSASWTSPKLAISSTGEAYILNSFNQPVIIGTTTLTSRGNEDVLIAKYNAQGTFEWAKQFGGSGDDIISQGIVDATGSLYIIADFTGPATLENTTLQGAGSMDGSLIKYSPDGTVQWAQTLGSSGADAWYGLSLDAVGNPYITGDFSNGARLGAITLTSAGKQDIVVASYTPQGQVRWVQQAGGPEVDYGLHVGLDALGNTFVVGRFSNSCSFGPLSLSSAINREAFIARLGTTVLATQLSSSTSTLSLYPNPATDAVMLSGVPVGSHVQLFDALGREVRTALVMSNATVSVRGLIPGLYTLRAVTVEGRLYVGKLMIEQ